MKSWLHAAHQRKHFRRVALTASYCTDLKSELDRLTGSFINGRHQTKYASEDVYRLASKLYMTGSVKKKHDTGIGDVLYSFNSVAKFNPAQFGDEHLDDDGPT
jgi:hypothetical protein